MKYAIVGVIALIVAGVFVLSAVPISSLEKASGLGSNSEQPSTEDNSNQATSNKVEDTDNETGEAHGHDFENDTHEYENETDEFESETGEHEDMEFNATFAASGGGWSTVNVSGVLYKDTFGVFVDGDAGNWSFSEFVFQGREKNETIHSVNFTSIVFDNTTVANLTYVRASGWAICNMSEGFWFRLVLLDNGSQSNDIFDLALDQDSNSNWVMDETTPISHWVFNGLEGGNIWVFTPTDGCTPADY